MNMKPVIVHLPIMLYNSEIAVVETEIELPEHWVPVPGNFFAHPLIPGRLTIHWAGYDARDNRDYVCLVVGHGDCTSTLEEWLDANPAWHIPADPTLTLAFQEPPSQ